MKKIFICCFLSLTFLASYAESFIISGIEFRGLQRISTGAAMSYIDLQVGDIYNEQSGQNLIAKVYASDFFDNIALERQDNQLIIVVKEKPVVYEVRFVGNKKIKTESIETSLDSIGLKRGHIFSKNKLSKTVKELTKAYHGIGFYQAQIQAKIARLSRNRVYVDLKISEGKVNQVVQINVLGNKQISRDEILDSMEIKEKKGSSLLSRRYQYNQNKLQADLERIRSLYLNQGFANFQINHTEVTLSDSKEFVSITIQLEEGELFRFRDSSFSTQNVVDEKSLREAILYKQGDVVSIDKIQKSIDAMGKLFTKQGYSLANIRFEQDIKNHLGVVDIYFNIIPNKRVYVRRIHISGNSRTNDRVIRRELAQYEGAVLNMDYVDISESRLRRLGYFNSIDIKVVPIDDSDKVDLHVKVNEGLTGSYRFGILFTGESDFVFQTGVGDSNIFGTGNRLNLNFDYSKTRQDVSLNFTDPYFTEDGHSVTYRVFL